MSDALPPVEVDEETPQTPAPAPSRPSIMRDPVVRRMAYIAFALVGVFLLLVVSALVTGVVTPSGPRTLSEREVAVSAAAVQEGSTDTAVWGEYIAALIADGQYGRARSVIAEGRRSLDDSSTAEFSLAETRLYYGQKQYKKAITAAEKTRAQIQKAYDALIAQGGVVERTAKLVGRPANYDDATLLEAQAYRALKDWKNALKFYDEYIKANAGASDVLVDRGNVKIDMGDTTGAEKDFREALRFVPDDPEALAGLKKIGVEK